MIFRWLTGNFAGHYRSLHSPKAESIFVWNVKIISKKLVEHFRSSSPAYSALSRLISLLGVSLQKFFFLIFCFIFVYFRWHRFFLSNESFSPSPPLSRRRTFFASPIVFRHMRSADVVRSRAGAPYVVACGSPFTPATSPGVVSVPGSALT